MLLTGVQQEERDPSSSRLFPSQHFVLDATSSVVKRPKRVLGASSPDASHLVKWLGKA